MYYFRADGSAVTGAGHLMRCLTVAQELQKRIEHPEELCFLCAEQASAELLQSWNMQVKILGTDPADLEGELSALEGLIRGSGHVFLVDSYAVTDAYLQALHRFGRVYLLDDMQQHAFPVDGVINYNLFASRESIGNCMAAVPDSISELLMCRCGNSSVRRQHSIFCRMM